MEETCWNIHAGKFEDTDKLFLDPVDSCVGIGWDKMGNLLSLENTREAYKKKLMEVYPETKKGAVNTVGGIPYRFVYEMKPGDYVVYSSTSDRTIHIGIITSDYIYDPDKSKDYCNLRSVKWLAHVPRSKFCQGALYEIGCTLSLSRIRNYTEDILSKINSDKLNTDTTPDEFCDDDYDYDDLESTTVDFLYKKIDAHFKGISFENLVAHMLNLIGYNTKITAPSHDDGIDIIAFKDELGIERPIIKVQAKSAEKPVTNAMVAALYGTVAHDEYGLFVSMGTYTNSAKDFAKSKSNLKLIDGQDFIRLIIKNYDNIAPKFKAVFPLKKIYVPTYAEE